MPDQIEGGRLEAWAARPDVQRGALVAIFVLGAFNLLWRLGRGDWIFDEILQSNDGWNAIHLRDPAADHPLVGKYLMGIGQLIFGRGAFGVRIVPALCSLAAVGLAFELGRRVAGWWSGIAAGGLWAALPRPFTIHGEVIAVVRIDRYSVVDTIWPVFALGMLLAAWWWFEKPSMQRAAVVGVVAGLAVGTKFTAVTMVLAVAVAALFMIRPLATAAVQVAVTAAASLTTFVVTYLPYGTAGPHMVRLMLKNQTLHSSLGATTTVGGRVWTYAPWWANLAYWIGAQGPILALTMVVAGCAAWWARNRTSTAYLWLAVLAPMGALGLSHVALAHYWVAWFGPLCVLAGIGTVAMLQRSGPQRWLGGALLAILLIASAVGTVQVATIHQGDYSRMAAAVKAQAGEPTTAISLGTDLSPYFPGVHSIFYAYAPKGLRPDLVVIERQLAEQANPQQLAALRARARRDGLTPHVIGHIEYWDRSRG